MTWVLLHGTPLNPQVWDGVRSHLTTETVAPDLNEAVASVAMSRLREAQIAGPGCLQSEVAAGVLAGLPDEGELVVVGHSLGGQVAIELALWAPERVVRLVIVCSRHTPFPAFAEGARSVRSGQVDVEGAMRRWFTPAELAAAGPAVTHARRQLLTAARGPWAASLEAIATYDRSGSVGRIAAPAALLAAGHDEVATPAVMAELAAALPHAGLEVVSAWAHMSPFVDPAALAARLTGVVEPARYPLRRE